MSSPRAYVLRETAISAAINGALTIAFYAAVFLGQETPSVWGARGLVVDCLPQGFMVGLMSVVPAMLITRKRLAAGAISPRSQPVAKPSRILPRAIACALAGLIGLTLAAAGLALLTGAQAAAFGAALGLKVLASVAITCLFTPPAVRAALATPPSPKG